MKTLFSKLIFLTIKFGNRCFSTTLFSISLLIVNNHDLEILYVEYLFRSGTNLSHIFLAPPRQYFVQYVKMARQKNVYTCTVVRTTTHNTTPLQSPRSQSSKTRNFRKPTRFITKKKLLHRGDADSGSGSYTVHVKIFICVGLL